MPAFSSMGSRRTLTRRGFLAGAGALVVSACGSSRSAQPRSSTPVVVANHPLYIDASTNPGFTATTGIAVEYHEEIDDDEAWLSSVRSRFERGQSIDRDVVIVSDWAADRLARNGWLAPGGPDRMGGRTVWAMGMVGIAFRGRSAEITTIRELFQPPLQGRVALPSDMRTAFGMALLADRVDPSTVSLAAATATASRLANSVRVGQVLSLGGPRPLDHLLAGEVDAAVVRASDLVGLEQDHPDIVFVVPEEGGLLLTDVAVVPVRGANPSGATAYLDYLRDPVHAAHRFRVVPALWPRESARDIEQVLRVDAPKVLADPRRNPPPDVLARLHPFRALSDRDEASFAALFDSVIHAAD